MYIYLRNVQVNVFCIPGTGKNRRKGPRRGNVNMPAPCAQNPTFTQSIWMTILERTQGRNLSAALSVQSRLHLLAIGKSIWKCMQREMLEFLKKKNYPYFSNRAIAVFQPCLPVTSKWLSSSLKKYLKIYLLTGRVFQFILVQIWIRSSEPYPWIVYIVR